MSTKQRRIATIAQRHREVALNNLSHNIDIYWLAEATQQIRKNSSPGIDQQSLIDYQDDLVNNLTSLLNRAKSGTYRAPAVKRVEIPKGTNGETRPIGIPTVEDKVLQRAVKMVLEPVYEEEFHEFSFGFRPGKSATHAIRHLRENIYHNRVRWILDIDIRKFFDQLDHHQLQEILRQRINDGVITRLIGKWLKAGVLTENKDLIYPESGTPQGGVISPLLANLYLHEVLDDWFVREVQPRLSGRSFLVRYADDAVLGFETREDAQRVLTVLEKRLAKYSLSLHPEKTRLVYFERPPLNGTRRTEEGKKRKPESFDFLGFTHYWRKSRKGTNVLGHKTMKARQTRMLNHLREWCRENRHLKLRDQCEKLRQKLEGYYAYYGISSNYRSLGNLYWELGRIWRKWLNRRSRRSKKANGMTWARFNRLTEKGGPFHLPPPRIVHSLYGAQTPCEKLLL